MNKPRILMCRPEHYGIEYEINPWMDVKVKADHDLAIRQWEALKRIVEDLGVEVELLDPVQGLPDLVFTANAGLVHKNLVILSKFRHGVRQGEEPYFQAWFTSHGFEVETMPLGMIFEGAGDALFCGEALFAGYRFRSDAKSQQWIGERLGVEALPLELVDPRFYHLDTCFCPLADDAAVYYPGAFDEYGRSVIQTRIKQLVEVTAEEAKSFSCNAVVVGRTVVLNETAGRLASDLAKIGFDTRPTSLTEFIKAGGSAKCLTLRLDGEEAAAWKRG